MDKQEETNDIFIRTIKIEEVKKEEILQEGIQKTVGTLDMPIDVIDGMVKLKLRRENEEQESRFEKLLAQTNEVIHTIADNLSKSIENVAHLSEMEIEFGIGITEKLNLGIFELGANQSLKVKIKLAKPKS
jgi:hypothetical protein